MLKKINIYMKDKGKVAFGHFKNLSAIIWMFIAGVIGVVSSVYGLINGDEIISYTSVIMTVIALSVPALVKYFKNFRNENLKIRVIIKANETKKAMKKVEMASKTIQAHKNADRKMVEKAMAKSQKEKNIEDTVVRAEIQNQKNKLK